MNASLQGSDLVGLIPAAGRGVRAYPHTATIPKSMLEVDGVPVLQRNVELMRDQLGIRDIRIVIGYHGEVIQRHFGAGDRFGVRITYVHNRRLDLELPYSVFLAGKDVEAPCCMILADECYIESNHAVLRTVSSSALVTCGVIDAESAKQIHKNYTVDLHDGRITDLHEKPQQVSGRLMGTGTYLLHPDVHRRLRTAFGDEDHARGPRDWTTWLASLARAGERIEPFHLTGRYININSRDDLHYANYLVRDRTFENKRTSLVFVIEDLQEAAVGAVADFAALDEIDEVVAVTRGECPELLPIAPAKVRVVSPPSADAPVGTMVKLGMDQASGDLLLLAYSDDTFAPRDLKKFLAYLRDADMVVGTRTTRQMIEQGANMRGIVRAAHIVLAKLLQLLWWRFESRFTDICCVYRGLWRSTYHAIRDHLSAEGVEVFPELTIEVLRARRRIIEIPIHYYNRNVEQAHVTSKYQSIGVFSRVASLLLRKRASDSWLGEWWNRRAEENEHMVEDHAAKAEAAHYRELERQWQDEVGVGLLDKPYEASGTAAVFTKQWDRIIRRIDPSRPGALIEIGCGKGHFLRRVRDTLGGAPRPLIGMDLSRAVTALPAHGLRAIRGDGEWLPFRDASAAYIIYDGALHHLIDYPAALRDAVRVLAPGGTLLLYEPATSAFNQIVHRLLDPIIFRVSAVYESPIDIRYKEQFHQDVIVRVLRGLGMRVELERSDFLAYPLTGCYAGSAFGRSERLMRWLMKIEDIVRAMPGLRQMAEIFAWRITIVGTK